jgi:hypothetical protein
MPGPGISGVLSGLWFDALMILIINLEIPPNTASQSDVIEPAPSAGKRHWVRLGVVAAASLKASWIQVRFSTAPLSDAQ